MSLPDWNRKLKGRAGATLVVLAAVGIGGATETRAAEPSNPPRGWFVALDGAFAQPAGTDQHVADQIDFSSTTPRGVRHVIENDIQFAPRLTVGYDFGAALGALRVSYWSFDGEDDFSRSMRGSVEPALFGYGYYGAAYLYDAQSVQVDATSSIKAKAFGVDYVRAMEGGRKLSVQWLAGLRAISFDEERTLLGRDDIIVVEQAKSINSNAFGFKFGSSALYKFGRVFRLEAGLALSLMQGDAEGDASQTMRDVDPNSPLIGVLSESRSADQNAIHGQILELDAKGVWTAGPLDVWFGYGASSWAGLVRDPAPSEPGGEDRDTLTFAGWRAGIKWRIGREKALSP